VSPKTRHTHSVQTKGPESKIRKNCKSKTHMYYGCWDPNHPNGSGTGIAIPLELTCSIRKQWSYKGYAHCILIHAQKPIRVISLYLPNALQNADHNRHQDMNNFLNPILPRGNNSGWDIICGGDFNSFTLNEIVDPKRADPNRPGLHIVHSQLERLRLIDIWKASHDKDPGYT
jgi:exonuclease III